MRNLIDVFVVFLFELIFNLCIGGALKDFERLYLQVESIHIKAGMEIPDHKPLKFALQYINGIGRSRANQVLAELHLENKLAKDLTKRELVDLSDEISKYMVGHELVS